MRMQKWLGLKTEKDALGYITICIQMSCIRLNPIMYRRHCIWKLWANQKQDFVSFCHMIMINLQGTEQLIAWSVCILIALKSMSAEQIGICWNQMEVPYGNEATSI